MFHALTSSSDRSTWKAVLPLHSEFGGKAGEFSEIHDGLHCDKRSYLHHTGVWQISGKFLYRRGEYNE